jgi:NDP-sugar pyrophosphorylase family protein
VHPNDRRSGTAIILAGGRGTRLGALTTDTPKPMLPIGGRPFIEYLIWQLAGAGIDRVVISCGYLGDAIRSHFGDGEAWGLRIDYSSEDSPLGTGGAARLASNLVDEERFLLLNGDSVCEVDCGKVLRQSCEPGLLGAMTLTRVPDGRRFGSVELDESGSRVIAFRQNDPREAPALVNAGVYALGHELVTFIPEDGPSSLERDVLPRLAGRIAGVVSDGYFIDMGLPATYEELLRDPAPLLRAVRAPGRFG